MPGQVLRRRAAAEPPWFTPLHDLVEPQPVAQPPVGWTRSWATTLPLVDTGRYLPYLVDRLEAAGGSLTRLPLAALPGRGLVVNCTGVAARMLASDPSVHPVRGQVVVLDDPGLTHWWCDEDGADGDLTFVVPRGRDLVVGGTLQDGEWDTTPDPRTASAILARASAVVPQIAQLPVRAHRVGLRPARPSVRLEVEERTDDDGPPVAGRALLRARRHRAHRRVGLRGRRPRARHPAHRDGRRPVLTTPAPGLAGRIVGCETAAVTAEPACADVPARGPADALCDFDVPDAELRAAGSVKWTYQPADVLPAWVAEMDCRPCPPVLDAVREAVDRGMFGYPALPQHTDLPEVTAAFLGRRFGWQVDPARVIAHRRRHGGGAARARDALRGRARRRPDPDVPALPRRRPADRAGGRAGAVRRRRGPPRARPRRRRRRVRGGRPHRAPRRAAQPAGTCVHAAGARRPARRRLRATRAAASSATRSTPRSCCPAPCTRRTRPSRAPRTT